MPCGLRPDKAGLTHPSKRLAMVQEAVKDFFPSGFPVKVDPVEVKNGQSIPTFHLIQQL